MQVDWPDEFPGAHWLDEEEERAVLDVLRSGSLFRYFGPGKPRYVEAFEAAAREFYGVRYAQAVSSGSGALITAMAALGVGPGCEVIVPALMWVATVAAVVQVNAIPVLCKVDDTFSMDPQDLEKKITSRTRLIVPVHMAGAPCDMDAILAVAGKHDIPVLEDCAQANGGKFRGQSVGTFAQMGIFSLQINKNMTAGEKGLFTQAWSAFGMDAAVWLAGTQGAVMMALDTPEAFGQLIDVIAETDYARTELAVKTDGVDMVVQRGWYSSTDFWSPSLFDRYVYPHLAELTALAHGHSKKFAYVITTGIEKLGPRIADAGADLLYFVDPVQDGIPLEKARRLFEGRLTVAGGTNALSLASADPKRIGDEVKRAMEVLGPTNRFILQPTDAIFPDTPQEGLMQMIEAWKKFR